jgi:hypothetical protein
MQTMRKRFGDEVATGRRRYDPSIDLQIKFIDLADFLFPDGLLSLAISPEKLESGRFPARSTCCVPWRPPCSTSTAIARSGVNPHL